MARCDICGREMLTAKGCNIQTVHIGGKAYKRIRCGDPRDFGADLGNGERCHDCGAMVGGIHHWGCDAERCPVCGGQMIGCECEEVFIEALGTNDE